MIGFLIFYFVFSAAFTLGVNAYDQDRVPLQEFVMAILLGWLFLPFALGILVSYLVYDK